MTDKQGYITLTSRDLRENELKAMMNNIDGRNQLVQLLRQLPENPLRTTPVGNAFRFNHPRPRVPQPVGQRQYSVGDGAGY